MESKSASEIDDSTEQLLRELRQVVQDGEQLLRAGASELNEKGTATRDRLSATLESAKETGRRLQEQTMAGAKATGRVIRENPYQSLGVALGIGLVIGIMLNRK